MDECNPPFEKAYKDLLCDPHAPLLDTVSAQDYDLPLIDASPLLHKTGQERESCVKEIGRASSEWGFFQVVNHGISGQLLNTIRREQEKLFRLPFDKKEKLHIFKDSYRWGTPNPKTLEKFSWSEAFHIPLSGISESEEIKSLRYAIEEFTTKVADLSQKLAEALVENMGITTRLFAENCTMNSCYLRLNRYPPCPMPLEIFGLVAHTDSDFLTVLCQDHIGGLQLMKDGMWVTVKPNPDALIVNVGDLFQVLSNNMYKSVEHRVIANKQERFSVAYFLCPSHDTLITSYKEPSLYKKFTFCEFQQQVQEDVKTIGYKTGLVSFRKSSSSFELYPNYLGSTTSEVS